MKSIAFNKALLIRLDRIGDLILTLPVDQLPCFADKAVVWAVTPGLDFIPETAEPSRSFITLNKKFSWSAFREFVSYLKEQNFDLAVMFHGPWWVGLALWWVGVRHRIGVRSQWHSFLFFNRGSRQKRSQALFHESEYNQRLVLSGLNMPSDPKGLKPLKLKASQEDLSEKLGLRFQSYFVVHPGMAGSARNWTTPLYIELIERLIKDDNVVITSSESDRKWVDPLHEHFGDRPKIQWMELKSAEDWRFILTFARAVLAPSTGTVHVAAALGTPTVGIYSPVRVQAPRRWAPKGERVAVVWPDVECPGHLKCLMENCPRFDCMRDIGVEEVYASLNKVSQIASVSEPKKR